MLCRICQGETTPLGKLLVLQKHKAGYRHCPTCHFAQVEDPFWLAEAYSKAITRSDIGLADRNLRFARASAPIIRFLFGMDGPFLDYGGGTGLFTRLMRDRGFDFYWEDAYCENQFAEGFQADPEGKFVLLTAMEVFEHLTDPLKTIEEMLRKAPALLFTTRLIASPPPALGQWWYYGPEHGQHVSFFSRRSLEKVAEIFNLHLYSDGMNIHLLSPKEIPSWWFRTLSHPFGVALSCLPGGKPSLLPSDFEQIGKER